MKDFEFKKPIEVSTTGTTGASIKISNGRLNISFPITTIEHEANRPQKTHRTVTEETELLVGNLKVKFKPLFEEIQEPDTTTLKDSKELSKLSLEVYAVIKSKKPQHDSE